MKKFQPLGDRVIVRRHEAEEKSKGGIIMPDSAREKPSRGEILAVGPGKLLDDGRRAPMSVMVGQVILFGKYSGSEVTIGDDKVVVVEEGNILAVEVP